MVYKCWVVHFLLYDCSRVTWVLPCSLGSLGSRACWDAQCWQMIRTIWWFPKSWGYPQSSSIWDWDFPMEINHPAIGGTPKFQETSKKWCTSHIITHTYMNGYEWYWMVLSPYQKRLPFLQESLEMIRQTPMVTPPGIYGPRWRLFATSCGLPMDFKRWSHGEKIWGFSPLAIWKIAHL